MTKPHTGKFINCLQCSNEFYIPRNRFDTAKYCSRKCQALHVRELIIRCCNICGKEFEHISSRCNKAKYCSRVCYHKSRKGRGTRFYKCKYCKKEFKDSPSKNRIYCSKACVNKSEKEIFTPKYSTVRKMMLRRNMIKECQKCGYNSYPDILGVHHKDGNRENNSFANLLVLCPMCHSLIHHKHICH